MDKNKTYKKIVYERKAISNLNDKQMDQQVGGRYLSAITLNGAGCNTINNCCTMYEDCDEMNIHNPSVYDCPSYITCISCNCITNPKCIPINGTGDPGQPCWNETDQCYSVLIC